MHTGSGNSVLLMWPRPLTSQLRALVTPTVTHTNGTQRGSRKRKSPPSHFHFERRYIASSWRHLSWAPASALPFWICGSLVKVKVMHQEINDQITGKRDSSKARTIPTTSLTQKLQIREILYLQGLMCESVKEDCKRKDSQKLCSPS